MKYAFKTYASPVGKLRLVADAESLVAILWENDNPARVPWLAGELDECSQPRKLSDGSVRSALAGDARCSGLAANAQYSGLVENARWPGVAADAASSECTEATASSELTEDTEATPSSEVSEDSKDTASSELAQDGLSTAVAALTRRPPAFENARHAVLNEVERQLDEYFEGRRRTFTVKLALVGTPFQQQVWRALTEIPFGETRSYAELARSLGRDAAVRAVGAANGRNPISIIVPCHRVIGRDGSLTGFAGGLETKSFLLKHEGAKLRSEPLARPVPPVALRNRRGPDLLRTELLTPKFQLA